MPDSQMSQARESVSREIVFVGKPFLIFVKCFQMLCRKPIIPLLSILPERDFLSLSDVHHKMDCIFFYHFIVYLKKHSLYSFRQTFLMTSTSKSLTQKILFSCCTVCLYGTEQSLMVKQGLDKGSATLEMSKIAFF